MIIFVSITAILLIAALVNRFSGDRLGGHYSRSFVSVFLAAIGLYLIATLVAGVLGSLWFPGDARRQGTMTGTIQGTIQAAAIFAIILRMIWAFVRVPKKIDGEEE